VLYPRPVSADLIDQAFEALSRARRILIFSGAGLSTESGIPDFRGPDGLWTKVDPSEFTIEKYHSNRDLRVRSWQEGVLGGRRSPRTTIEPNRGHYAIVKLHEGGRLAGVVTQNIDGLHHKSGLSDANVAELHGNTRGSHCLDCGRRWPTEEILQLVEAGDEDPHCPDCSGLIKTDVVMFGEMLSSDDQDKAMLFLAMADAVIAVGSTISVWPAAGIVLQALNQAKPLVIINQGETDFDALAEVKIDAAIGDTLPALVDRLLEREGSES
jgi:NAD-dependent deacetylase